MQMLWCHQLFQGHGCSSGCSCNPVPYVLSFGCPRPAPATCHGQHLQSSAVQVFLYVYVVRRCVFPTCVGVLQHARPEACPCCASTGTGRKGLACATILGSTLFSCRHTIWGMPVAASCLACWWHMQLAGRPWARRRGGSSSAVAVTPAVWLMGVLGPGWPTVSASWCCTAGPPNLRCHYVGMLLCVLVQVLRQVHSMCKLFEVQMWSPGSGRDTGLEGGRTACACDTNRPTGHPQDQLVGSHGSAQQAVTGTMPCHGGSSAQLCRRACSSAPWFKVGG